MIYVQVSHPSDTPMPCMSCLPPRSKPEPRMFACVTAAYPEPYPKTYLMGLCKSCVVSLRDKLNEALASELPDKMPETVCLDGVMDDRGIRYRGTATRQPNGKYHAMAIVNGALCWVECDITVTP